MLLRFSPLWSLLLVLGLAGCGAVPPGAKVEPAVVHAAAHETTSASDAPADSESDPMSSEFALSDAEWKARLTPEQYRVLREKGTERPFVNKFDEHFESGTYSCAACGQELFQSDTKFNSGCGWPAFYAAAAGDRIKQITDVSHGMVRTEVTCARCKSHLGHIFDDAPQTPTGQRYCINSVSLTFTPAKTKE